MMQEHHKKYFVRITAAQSVNNSPKLEETGALLLHLSRSQKQ